jgi:hypothetical protein
MIRTYLVAGPRILLAQWEVLAPFYITQNTPLYCRPLNILYWPFLLHSGSDYATT